MPIKVIITGATGMVGEGVLLTCLAHPEVAEVLIVNRKHVELEHEKLKELIVPDFMQIHEYTSQLAGYDACFYCAGISSVGMSEEKYTHITYDTTLHFARTLSALNPGMVFDFVTGSHTDSSEKGKIMWARVKGRTENALKVLPFRGEYNFRPGGMQSVPGQKNSKLIYRAIVGLIALFAPRVIISFRELGIAMIHTVTKGYHLNVLEIKDIKALAKS